MSNCVNIVPTEFVNLRTGTSTYGVRIYDNYENMYSNYWEKEQVPDDDLELLKFCLNDDVCFNDVASAMFEFIAEEQTGIFIAEEYYEWERIKPLFQDKK